MLTNKLHDQSTSVGAGKIIEVVDDNKLGVHTFGTSTDFKIEFKGSSDGENWFEIYGTEAGTNNYQASFVDAVNKGRQYEFNVDNCMYFKSDLTHIENGNISVVASLITSNRDS